MALEDVESWVGGVVPTILLVDTINGIDYDCKALLLDPVYRSCFKFLPYLIKCMGISLVLLLSLIHY